MQQVQESNACVPAQSLAQQCSVPGANQRTSYIVLFHFPNTVTVARVLLQSFCEQNSWKYVTMWAGLGISWDKSDKGPRD